MLILRWIEQIIGDVQRVIFSVVMALNFGHSYQRTRVVIDGDESLDNVFVLSGERRREPKKSRLRFQRY